MKKFITTSLLVMGLILSGFGGFGLTETKAEAAMVGEKAADVAQQFVGVPYRYGGTTPKGFDCSGFVGYSFKLSGKALPRSSGDMYTIGTLISKSSLRKGDLVFFNTSGTRISHVGIYLGNNKFIHSANSGVRYDTISSGYWKGKYVGAKRVS